MTLDGLGRRGLGITTDDFVIWTKPPPIPRTDENLFTTFTMMQAVPLTTSEPPILVAEPAPAPTVDPGTNSTGTFAPENPPPFPAPTSSPQPAPAPAPQQAEQVQGGENTVKIAIAVGGTLVLAAFLMKGR